MFDVKSVAIATTRANRTIVTTQLARVHAELDRMADCTDSDDDSKFFKKLGERDALVAQLLLSEQFERSLQSARPEALALLVA